MKDLYIEDPWISSYPEESYRERYCGYDEEDDPFAEPWAIYDPED